MRRAGDRWIHERQTSSYSRNTIKDENVPVLHRHSWEQLSRSSQSVRSPPPAGCCYSSYHCWHSHQSYHTGHTLGPARQKQRAKKMRDEKLSATEALLEQGAMTDPVWGWDVNQETSPLVPADGDVLSQQQSVKLARAYHLHLRALQHGLLHFHLHERQKEEDKRRSKTTDRHPPDFTRTSFFQFLSFRFLFSFRWTSIFSRVCARQFVFASSVCEPLTTESLSFMLPRHLASQSTLPERR